MRGAALQAAPPVLLPDSPSVVMVGMGQLLVSVVLVVSSNLNDSKASQEVFLPSLYLKVDGLHFVLEGMGFAHQGQNRGDLLWVIEVLHHRVDGTHDPLGVLPQLQAPLHLQRVVHVLELAEVLFGRWKVDKKPCEKEQTEHSQESRGAGNSPVTSSTAKARAH